MPHSNSKLKAIVTELERRRSMKSDSAGKSGSHLVAIRLNEYVPPPTGGSKPSSNQTDQSPASRSAFRIVSQSDNDRESFTSTLQDASRRVIKVHQDHEVENDQSAQSNPRHVSTIICERCGKCKCSRCRADRELPSIAHVSVNDEPCTVDTLIDTVTCMNVVGTLTRRMRSRRRSRRFHRHQRRNVAVNVEGNEDENNNENENDSSLGEIDDDEDDSLGERVAHWSVVTALSVVLPCVVCYWPLRGARAAATRCYNAPFVRTNVCHCRSSSHKKKQKKISRGRDVRASFCGGRVHRFVKTPTPTPTPIQTPTLRSEIVSDSALHQSAIAIAMGRAELKADGSIRKLT